MSAAEERDVPAHRLFFERSDVLEAFALVVDRHRAEQYTSVWTDMHREYMAHDAVVKLPSSYKVRLRGVSPSPSADEERLSYEPHLHDGIGELLLRFTDVTLTLVAAANPHVRARFDRLKVPYAKATIDDPAAWARTLEYLRAQDMPTM